MTKRQALSYHQKTDFIRAAQKGETMGQKPCLMKIYAAIFLALNLGFWGSCKKRDLSQTKELGEKNDPEPIDKIGFVKFFWTQNKYIDASKITGAQSIIKELLIYQKSINKQKNPKDYAVAERALKYYQYLLTFEQDGGDKLNSTSLAHTNERGDIIKNVEYLARIVNVVVLPEWFNNADMMAIIASNDDAKIRARLAEINTNQKRTGGSQVLFIRYAERPGLGSGNPSDGRDTADRRVFFIPASGNQKLHFAVMFSGKDTASIIAVDRSSGKPQTYYYDQIWSQAGIKAPAVASFANACVICHKSGGFFAINPNPSVPHDDLSLAAIKVLNKFVEYSGVSHHDVYDQIEKKLEPGFPTIDSENLTPERIQELLDAKRVRLPFDVDLKVLNAKISETESCSECHSDNRNKITTLGYRARAAIRPPASLGMVREGLMPPQNSFTKAEAKVFAQLLVDDYEERLLNYFLGKATLSENH